ncbi:hypothetical protein [Microbacterium sp. oral taxon 186]|uniref:hypothetical protein n=1 Tax=Microbacterium sp. oral taxon 186 TaxID=712383 RepID=UPI00055DE7C6|nr:hypothetical protein [Microbacterium sp. oral taxon 186]
MTRRRHVLSAVVAVALAESIVGCTPQSTPSPAPRSSASTFSSDAEAFAAAEATYRAYVDALNKVDLARTETFNGVYDWLTGTALEQERTSLTDMHDKGWTVSGDSRVVFFEGRAVSPSLVTAVACLDVSNIRLDNADGVSQVQTSRPPAYALQLSFTREEEAGRTQILEMTAVEEPRCS